MRIAFLTNILTPYRVFFFDCLFKHLGADNLKVFVMTEELPLRPWRYSDLKREYTELLKGLKVFWHGNDYLFSYNVNKSILEYKPEVLIIAGSWTYPTTWQVMMSKRLKRHTKIFFWTESHNHTGLSNSTKTNAYIRKIKKNLMERFDGFCLPGKYALETISELVDVSKKQIVHLPNLVDNKYYDMAGEIREKKQELRYAKKIAVNQFVFFTPARMCDLKGQIPFFNNVVDAIKGKTVTFVLAGEGPDRAEIERIGREHGLDIRIYNYQNQGQIREWFSLADAFLLPSLSDPNPLSNIEAAWAGLPLCISCYVGNGPELVIDGENGVIFDTLDKTSVCERISFILCQDKTWIKNASEISHRKAKEGFEADSESKKFIESIIGTK